MAQNICKRLMLDNNKKSISKRHKTIWTKNTEKLNRLLSQNRIENAGKSASIALLLSFKQRCQLSVIKKSLFAKIIVKLCSKVCWNMLPNIHNRFRLRYSSHPGLRFDSAKKSYLSYVLYEIWQKKGSKSI